MHILFASFYLNSFSLSLLIQILQKRMQVFTVKVTSSTEKHLIGSSPREIEDAVNELQRQLGDFDKTVEEYKQNLDMSVKLQQAMDEVWMEKT